jgi:uncharacterized protein YbaR (Trm112 family)
MRQKQVKGPVLLYQKKKGQQKGEFLCSACGKFFPTNDPVIANHRFRVHRCKTTT